MRILPGKGYQPISDGRPQGPPPQGGSGVPHLKEKRIKTIEPLDFLQHSAPTFTVAQALFMVGVAERTLNGQNDGEVVDKGHCLNIKVDNVLEKPATVLPLTPEMKEFVIHEYAPRKCDEYPVKSRFLPAKTAELKKWNNTPGYVHVIAYTKEQLLLEGIEIESDYGVVALNVEMWLEETPMSPDTLIRNMSTQYGGNGKWTFDVEEYSASQEFWATHVRVK